MLLTDIAEEISLLSRFEKILLIEKISRMLLTEEDPAHYFDPQKKYILYTPLGQEKAAGQLQQFLDQQRLQ